MNSEINDWHFCCIVILGNDRNPASLKFLDESIWTIEQDQPSTLTPLGGTFIRWSAGNGEMCCTTLLCDVLLWMPVGESIWTIVQVQSNTQSSCQPHTLGGTSLYDTITPIEGMLEDYCHSISIWNEADPRIPGSAQCLTESTHWRVNKVIIVRQFLERAFFSRDLRWRCTFIYMLCISCAFVYYLTRWVQHVGITPEETC